LSAVALVGGYLWKLVWPVHLSAFYIFHESKHILDSQVLLGLLALLICANLFAWLWSRAHIFSFAFVWMAATLAPVLNARWMPAGVFAERYLYLPSAGFCWLVACLGVWLWRSKPSANAPEQRPIGGQAVPLVLIVIVVLYSARTVRRNRDWRSDEALYTRTLDEQPAAQLIRTNLGVVYWARGDQAGAEREWTRALGPAPAYAPTLNDLGLLRENQKRYAEAIDFLDQAIRLRPKFMDPYKNLAETYAEMGRPADADRIFRQAVALAPLSMAARNSYGLFLIDQKRFAEAHEQFTRSAEADPNSVAYDNLGDLLLRGGELSQSRAAYQSALALNTFDNHANFGLAGIDEREGRTVEAIREYRAGLQTDPMNSNALAAVSRLASVTNAH
jgi:Tfp pilus assembly protein PilF